VATLGQALAFFFQAQDSPESQLLHYLRDKELLLILDNFEQLANEPVLAFVRQLLDAAPDLKLLITSRARLNLQGEQLYWLQGLPVPVTTTRTVHLSVAELASYSSVQLFLTTVQRLRSHYTLSTDDAPAVVAICQQVQGMPLALELAAAWMSVLTPAAIAAELARTLDFLTSDLQDLPLRQRSMRAVFAASWRLLTEMEQRIFQQLSVFRGSFTHEAAVAVTGASLPVLMSLIHKSFVQRTPDGRYQIHELLRQFGEEQLTQSPVEEATTQDRHSAYYLTFLAQRTPGLMGPEQPTLLNEIGQEIDNIRTGWLWAARQGRIDQLDATLDGLHEYYEVRSQYEEGIELFMLSIQSEQSAGSAALSQHIINRIQTRQGALNCEFGYYEQARTLLAACLAAARGLDDKKEVAYCLDYLGRTVWWQESGVAALPLLEESLLIRRTLGDQMGVATTLDILASVCDMSCEFAQAWQFAQQGLAVSRTIGHTYRTASLLRRLGSAAVGLGEYTGAVSYYQEALATFRQLDDHYGIVQALAEMGRTMYGAGDYPRDTFIGALEEAAMLAHKLGNYLALYYSIGIMGDVSNWIGEYETGERCGQELVELSRDMPPNFLASCLRMLGESELGLGKLHLARQHLLEVLAVMLKSETRLLINCQVAMLAWANLLCRECMQPDVASQPNHIQERQARALEIVSSLLHEEKSRPMYKARAAALAAKLEAMLPSAVAAVAKASGMAKTAVQIATEIVNQAAESSCYFGSNSLT
jgi:predicted ATPase